jgi:hypothetical protein
MSKKCLKMSKNVRKMSEKCPKMSGKCPEIVRKCPKNVLIEKCAFANIKMCANPFQSDAPVSDNTFRQQKGKPYIFANNDVFSTVCATSGANTITEALAL